MNFVVEGMEFLLGEKTFVPGFRGKTNHVNEIIFPGRYWVLFGGVRDDPKELLRYETLLLLHPWPTDIWKQRVGGGGGGGRYFR